MNRNSNEFLFYDGYLDALEKSIACSGKNIKKGNRRRGLPGKAMRHRKIPPQSGNEPRKHGRTLERR